MAIPSKFGRYEIKSELGRGGMATVYRAHDPLFDREVALKVLPREMLHDPQFRTRFDRELKIVAALEHPAIVPVYDVGEEDGQPYFVMRYMNGGSLSSEIEKGRFSLEDAARIIEKIAHALAYAHKKGIIHRDLKPDNILFDDTGAPFISDFGIAKLSESAGGNLTGSGVVGTPAYMSPEQAQGNDIDGRSDVYGLGVIVYQMLSGQQPYSADTPMGVVVKHITEPVPEILKALPTLPNEVDSVIKGSMAKDKTKRFSTTIDLAKALNVVAFGNEGNIAQPNATGIRTGTFKPDGIKNQTSTPSKSKTGFVVAGAVILVLLVGFFLLRNQLFPAPVPTSTPTLVPVTFTSIPVTSTITSIPFTATAEVASAIPFAPACSADISIVAPVVEQTNRACITKIPYTTIRFTEGATFEALDPALKCNEELTQNGFTTITCTGAQLIAYDLKVCNPPELTNEELSQCSTDSTFDTANQCCVAIPPTEAGCVIFEVGIGGCP